MINKRSAVLWLAGANVLFFIVQSLSEAFTRFFLLRSADLAARPYILLTHMFLHGDLMHLLFNMYALVIFGGLLEQRIGSKRFIQLYFAAGLIAGFGASFFYPSSLGASGAIMGILAALIVIMPNLRILFFFAIPMPFWVAGIAWALMDIMGIFFPHGVGNIAHLLGMAVGLAYAFYLRKRYGKKKVHIIRNKSHLDEKDINEFIRSGRL